MSDYCELCGAEKSTTIVHLCGERSAEPAKTTAVDDARPQDESSVAFLHNENRSLRAKAAELEAQLRQEREAHQKDCLVYGKCVDKYQAQVAQLQTTISQLDQLITSLWDFATFTPAIGCAFEEMRVLKESLARLKASIIANPEEEAK